MSTMAEIFRNSLHDSLDKVEQTSTVEAFYSHFEIIKSMVVASHPHLPEVYFADRFIYGLRNDIQSYVINCQPCTVFDAYHLALIYEYSLYRQYFPESKKKKDDIYLRNSVKETHMSVPSRDKAYEVVVVVEELSSVSLSVSDNIVSSSVVEAAVDSLDESSEIVSENQDGNKNSAELTMHDFNHTVKEQVFAGQDFLVPIAVVTEQQQSIIAHAIISMGFPLDLIQLPVIRDVIAAEEPTGTSSGPKTTYNNELALPMLTPKEPKMHPPDDTPVLGTSSSYSWLNHKSQSLLLLHMGLYTARRFYNMEVFLPTTGTFTHNLWKIAWNDLMGFTTRYNYKVLSMPLRIHNTIAYIVSYVPSGNVLPICGSSCFVITSGISVLSLDFSEEIDVSLLCFVQTTDILLSLIVIALQKGILQSAFSGCSYSLVLLLGALDRFLVPLTTTKCSLPVRSILITYGQYNHLDDYRGVPPWRLLDGFCWKKGHQNSARTRGTMDSIYRVPAACDASLSDVRRCWYFVATMTRWQFDPGYVLNGRFSGESEFLNVASLTESSLPTGITSTAVPALPFSEAVLLHTLLSSGAFYICMTSEQTSAVAKFSYISKGYSVYGQQKSWLLQCLGGKKAVVFSLEEGSDVVPIVQLNKDVVPIALHSFFDANFAQSLEVARVCFDPDIPSPLDSFHKVVSCLILKINTQVMISAVAKVMPRLIASLELRGNSRACEQWEHIFTCLPFSTSAANPPSICATTPMGSSVLLLQNAAVSKIQDAIQLSRAVGEDLTQSVQLMRGLCLSITCSPLQLNQGYIICYAPRIEACQYFYNSTILSDIYGNAVKTYMCLSLSNLSVWLIYGWSYTLNYCNKLQYRPFAGSVRVELHGTKAGSVGKIFMVFLFSDCSSATGFPRKFVAAVRSCVTILVKFVAGLYSGFNISCAGISVYRGLYFGMYNSLKPVLFTGKLEDSFLASFGLGWLSTNGAGLASYPIDIVRRRMMMTSGGCNVEIRSNLVPCRKSSTVKKPSFSLLSCSRRMPFTTEGDNQTDISDFSPCLLANLTCVKIIQPYLVLSSFHIAMIVSCLRDLHLWQNILCATTKPNTRAITRSRHMPPHCRQVFTAIPWQPGEQQLDVSQRYQVEKEFNVSICLWWTCQLGFIEFLHCLWSSLYASSYTVGYPFLYAMNSWVDLVNCVAQGDDVDDKLYNLAPHSSTLDLVEEEDILHAGYYTQWHYDQELDVVNNDHRSGNQFSWIEFVTSLDTQRRPYNPTWSFTRWALGVITMFVAPVIWKIAWE